MAVAAAVTALVAVLIDLNRQSDTAAKISKELNDIREEAQKEIVEEKTKLENLRKASMDETRSLNERYAAISELNRIVPNYNATIDKTTGKYIENKQALDQYIASLAHLYEVQGAKKRIQKLSEDKVDLELKKQKVQERYNDAKKAGFGMSYTTSWGATGNTRIDATSHLKSELDDIKSKLEEKNKILSTITKVYGNDIQSQEVQKVINNNKNKGGGSSGETEKERKAREMAEKKAAAEARKREAEAKRKQKQAADSIKAETNQLLAENAKAYAEGTKTYQQFVDDRQSIQLSGFEKLKQLFGEESNEFKQLLDNQVSATKQHDDAILKMNEQTIERERLIKQANIKSQYNDVKSDIYQNDIALDEAIYQNDVDAMQKRLALYNKGSEEWLDLKAEMEQAALDHQLQMQEAYQNQLRELRQQFGKQDIEAEKQMYLNGLENIYKKGLIKEEEYLQMKLELIEQYADRKAQLEAEDHGAGSTKLKVDRVSNRMVNQAKAEAGDAQSPANASFGGYFTSQIANYQNTMEKLKELYGNDKQNHAAYMQAKAQVTADFLDNMVQQTSAAYNGINNILSAASAYAQACSDLEQAKISKNYEKQIAAAGNNSKKKKKLEEKRDKELAAAKSKANKKAMKIEIAQAIASTAMAAINAYSSAAAIPGTGWIMAPIAAGLATAAGMMQIATIKKQHQAEAAGYYEGGYTGGNRYRKEAGVVHEGEFVANHRAVNNSSIRPAFDLIDRAQRANTVGSLTADDISRALGAGASAAVVAPIVNVSNDNAEVRQSLDGVNFAVSRLNKTIENGIKADVSIAGRDGIDRRLKEYHRMLDNK